MILDKQNQLSLAQAITSSAMSTNTIDLGSARDIGAGEEISIVITVDELVTAAGNATVDFQVVTSSSPAYANATLMGSTGPVPKTQLQAGRRAIELKIPRAILNAQPQGQRYFHMQYVVASGPLTSGKFSAAIVVDFNDPNAVYPIGYSIT